MDFETYLVGLGLSAVTIAAHLQKYKIIQRSNLDYNDTNALIAFVELRDSPTKRIAYCATLLKILSFHNLSWDALATYKYQQNKMWNKHHTQRKNQVIEEVTHTQLIDCMMSFYQQQEWRSFVVMYALLQRNATLEDLVSTVIHVYEERKGNCFVISKNKKVVKWYRGNRLDKFQSAPFVHAIQHLSYVLQAPDYTLPVSLDTIHEVKKRYKDTACV